MRASLASVHSSFCNWKPLPLNLSLYWSSSLHSYSYCFMSSLHHFSSGLLQSSPNWCFFLPTSRVNREIFQKQNIMLLPYIKPFDGSQLQSGSNLVSLAQHIRSLWSSPCLPIQSSHPLLPPCYHTHTYQPYLTLQFSKRAMLFLCLPVIAHAASPTWMLSRDSFSPPYFSSQLKLHLLYEAFPVLWPGWNGLASSPVPTLYPLIQQHLQHLTPVLCLYVPWLDWNSFSAGILIFILVSPSTYPTRLLNRSK